MSIHVMSWVAAQEIKPSQTKFVLFALADFCNDQGLAWPSVETICAFTSQDDKTVRKALKNLTDMGFISDTTERAGEKRQIKVWKFNLPDAVILKIKIPKNGYLPKIKGTRPSPKGTRISPQRYPNTGSRTIREPLITNKSEKRTAKPEHIASHLANLKAATNKK